MLQDIDQVGQLLDVMLSGVNDGADFLERGLDQLSLFEANLPIRIELDEHGVHGVDSKVHSKKEYRIQKTEYRIRKNHSVFHLLASGLWIRFFLDSRRG